MSNLKIEVNYAGVGEMLKSSEMQSLVGGIANTIANNAGNGYASDTKLMGTRWIASAYTDTTDAMKDCNENNTLLKALHI